MKSKTIMQVLVLASLATVALNLTPPVVHASTLPSMYVVPPSVGAGLAPGDSFSVDVMIADAEYNEGTDVYAWQVLMTWNNTLLDIDDMVTWGDFMDIPRVGPWGLLQTDAAAGQNITDVIDGSAFINPTGWGGKVLIQDAFNSEINTVALQEGNRLTLQNNLANTYTTAAGGGVYPWPNLLSSCVVNPARNRIVAGVCTLGSVPGVSGSGLLCTLTFEVLAVGDTALDINAPFLGETQTYIINSNLDTLGDEVGELVKLSGHFCNLGPAQCDLSVCVVGSGTTDPAPGVCTYDEGAVVDVTAHPDSGWVLDHWELDGADVGDVNPCSITMDGDHTLTAVFHAWIPVAVDIKPGSWPNPLQLNGKGVLPVAICGAEDFDVTTIDPTTLRLAVDDGGAAVAPVRWSLADVATPYTGEPCSGHDLGGDGYLDLTLKFKTQETIATLSLDAFNTGDVVILILVGNLKEE
ncbi:MAG: hypothetical protein JSV87_02140, partial [Candidatus Bathyarchaeota archaeon]